MSWREWPPWQARAQKQADADRIKREGERHKEIVDALHALADELKADREQQTAESAKKESREIWTIVGLFSATGVALLGLGVSLWQVHLTRRSILDAESNSTQQATDTQRALTLTSRAADAATKQAALLEASNQTAKDTLLVNTRAWIGFQGASSPEPAVNTELPVKVQYVNTGREPAIGVKVYVQGIVFTDAEQKSGEAGRIIAGFDQGCPAARADSVGVAYPTTGFSSYTLTHSLQKQDINAAVISGDRIIAMVGCFTYQAFAVTRHSYFCFFYQAKRTQATSWNFCEGGNYED